MKKLITSVAIGIGVVACPVIVNAEEISQENHESGLVDVSEEMMGGVEKSIEEGSVSTEMPVISEEIAEGIDKIQADIDEINLLNTDAQNANDNYIEAADFVQEIVNKDVKECEELAKEDVKTEVEINKTLEDIESKTKEVTEKAGIVQKEYDNAVEKATTAREKLKEIKDKNGLNEGEEIKGEAKNLMDKASGDVSKAEQEVTKTKDILEKAKAEKQLAQGNVDDYLDAIETFENANSSYNEKKDAADIAEFYFKEAVIITEDADREKELAESEFNNISDEKNKSDEKLKMANENYLKAMEELDSAKQLHSYDEIKEYYEKLVKKEEEYKNNLAELEPLVKEAEQKRDDADQKYEEIQEKYDLAYAKAQIPTATEEDKELVKQLEEELEVVSEESSEAWETLGELLYVQQDIEYSLKIVEREIDPAFDDYMHVCNLVKNYQEKAAQCEEIKEELLIDNKELAEKQELAEKRLSVAISSQATANSNLKKLQDEFVIANEDAENARKVRDSLVAVYYKAIENIDSAQLMLENSIMNFNSAKEEFGLAEEKLDNAIEVKRLIDAKIDILKNLDIAVDVSFGRVESINIALENALLALETARDNAKKLIVDEGTMNSVVPNYAGNAVEQNYSDGTIYKPITYVNIPSVSVGSRVNPGMMVTVNSGIVTRRTVGLTTIKEDAVPLNGDFDETKEKESNGSLTKQNISGDNSEMVQTQVTKNNEDLNKHFTNVARPLTAVGAILILGSLMTVFLKKRI